MGPQQLHTPLIGISFVLPIVAIEFWPTTTTREPHGHSRFVDGH